MLRLGELSEGSGGTVGIGSGIEIKGLTADSRAVEPGFLFAALPGTRAHGRDFILEALQRGAVAVLADPGTALPQPDAAVLVTDPNPRRRLSLMAAVFYREQPKTIAAVTGTSGKTSTVAFTRQIWAALGAQATSLGTLGLIAPGREEYLPLTTLDPVALHQRLAELARAGIDHLAIEASSHGLDQFRLDGVRIAAAAFTNISHEHLDYHGSMAAYFTAKKRLFAELLPAGAPAVLNADTPEYPELERLVRSRGGPVLSYGRSGTTLRLEQLEAVEAGQKLTLQLEGARYEVLFPVPGAFQAMNALAALGLVIATGGDPARAARALTALKGVRGRIEHVATHPSGARIYVDYAHKPDALETVLTALRPHASERLVVVFGCGGDRDRAKRPLMGAIATRLASHVIVTDDNPRSEDPAAIRREILSAAPHAVEIGDRGAAIRAAVAGLAAGDLLVIAGKGHETGQMVGTKVLPFDDAEAARAAVRSPDGGAAPLWTAADAATATGGTNTHGWTAGGVSIDSRSLKPGDLFVALAGPNFDGHDFIAAAFAAGAAAAIASRRPAALPAEAPLLMVTDAMAALEALGRAARARSAASFAAITGSVGKTGTKEALRLVLSSAGPTTANEGNLNNQWGAPLSLARMPRDARYGVFELGMNHAGEIAPLSRLVRPHVALITTVEPAHLEFFPSVEAIADAKAEIFLGVEPGGAAVLNRDNAHFERLAEAAQAAGIARIVGFGEHPRSEARLLSCRLDAEASTVEAQVLGVRVDYRLPMPGRHIVQNSLAVLAAAALLGVEVHAAAATLSRLAPLKGRGARLIIDTPQGALTLIDESYNASPAAMHAAIAVLGRSAVGRGGRRIAVLGDMRELGVGADRLHAELATALAAAGVDLLLCCGTHMRALADAVGSNLAVEHAFDSTTLLPRVLGAVKAGDVVLVKGSLGSRMAPIVDALKGLGCSPLAANGS